ncbi:MAG: DUF3237 domain-containing protein [Dehalococcoidia bacterium]
MKLEFLLEFNVTVQEPAEHVGQGPFGDRTIYTVTGGGFEGPRLRGKILSGGAGDWLLVDSRGIARLDVRGTMQTDDGALIYLHYLGVVTQDPSRPPRPAGEPEEYGDAYFMTSPSFETGDERYAWLNDLVCVGEGKMTSTGVAYRVYAAVND